MKSDERETAEGEKRREKDEDDGPDLDSWVEPRELGVTRDGRDSRTLGARSYFWGCSGGGCCGIIDNSICQLCT